MYEHLRRSDADWKAADTKKNYENRKLEGYIPSGKEKEEANCPRQVMKLENRFGKAELGVSDKGEMTFAVSKKADPQQNPAAGGEKTLQKERSVEKEDDVYASNTGASKSVLVYKENLRTGRKRERMMEKIRKTVEQEPNDVADTQLPFWNLKADKKRLQELEDMLRTERTPRLEHQKEQLEQEIMIKEQRKRKLNRQLTAAMKEREEKRTDEEYDLDWIWKALKLAAAAAMGGGTEEEGGGEEQENAEEKSGNQTVKKAEKRKKVSDV